MSTVELSVPRSLDARPSVNARGMAATSNAGWWRFLARWSLLAALNGVIGWAIFLSVSAQGVSLEGERGDLNVALQFPALWRVAMAYDTLAWLFIGGPRALPPGARPMVSAALKRAVTTVREMPADGGGEARRLSAAMGRCTGSGRPEDWGGGAAA